MAQLLLTCFRLKKVQGAVKEYAESVFLAYVINYCAENVKRIVLVWDHYLTNILKQDTREARGTGTRRRVHDNATIPLNWKSL